MHERKRTVLRLATQLHGTVRLVPVVAEREEKRKEEGRREGAF